MKKKQNYFRFMISDPETSNQRGIVTVTLNVLTKEVKLQNSQHTTNESNYKLLQLKQGSQDGLLISFIHICMVFRYAVFKSQRNLGLRQALLELKPLYQVFS